MANTMKTAVTTNHTHKAKMTKRLSARMTRTLTTTKSKTWKLTPRCLRRNHPLPRQARRLPRRTAKEASVPDLTAVLSKMTLTKLKPNFTYELPLVSFDYKQDNKHVIEFHANFPSSPSWSVLPGGRKLALLVAFPGPLVRSYLSFRWASTTTWRVLGCKHMPSR
jgi:hypothetical protein